MKKIIFCILLTLTLISGCKKQETKETIWVPYYVTNGETLWNIASQIEGEGDIREVIYEIKIHNGIDSNLKAGQVIEIPQERRND